MIKRTIQQIKHWIEFLLTIALLVGGLFLLGRTKFAEENLSPAVFRFLSPHGVKSWAVENFSDVMWDTYYRDLRSKVSRSTVTIETPHGKGSGFIVWMGTNYWVVSNTHVIGGAFQIEDLAILNQQGEKVQVEPPLMADLHGDVAMLPLKTGAVPPAFLTIGKDTDAGDAILSAGNATGTGIVSTMPGSVMGVGALHGVPILEVTSPIVGGCSGGPIVNTSGEVVGINTYTFTPPKKGAEAERLKDTPFDQTRRMGVRSAQLSSVQPFEFSHIFLHHKALRDRMMLFALMERAGKASPDEVIFDVDTCLASEDQTIMPMRTYEGVRSSGMLQAYYDAFKAIRRLAVRMSTHGQSAAGSMNVRSDLDIVSRNLAVRKDCTFVDQDAQETMDRGVSGLREYILERTGD